MSTATAARRISHREEEKRWNRMRARPIVKYTQMLARMLRGCCCFVCCRGDACHREPRSKRIMCARNSHLRAWVITTVYNRIIAMNYCSVLDQAVDRSARNRCRWAKSAKNFILQNLIRISGDSIIMMNRQKCARSHFILLAIVV